MAIFRRFFNRRFSQSFYSVPVVPTPALLLENGFYLLLEDGSKLLLE